MADVFFRYTVDGVEVSFRYDADLVEVLKIAVPSYARRWHPDRRVWWISRAEWPNCQDEMEEWGDVRFVDITTTSEREEASRAKTNDSAEAEARLRQKEEDLNRKAVELQAKADFLAMRETLVAQKEAALRNTSSTGQSTNGPHAALYLLPSAPAAVAEAVYKTLVKIYHPDRGGSTTKMAQINAAYDKIKGRR